MNRRGLRQSLIFSIVLVLLSLSVYAQTGSKLTEIFQNIGEFFFHDIGSMGAYGFKFLLWLTLFALIDYGLKKGAKWEGRVTHIVSFTVSAATIIIIPGKAIIKIFSLYSFIVVAALGLLVPLILFMAIYKNFGGGDISNRMIRTFGYFIAAAAMFWFTANVNSFISGELQPSTGIVDVGLLISFANLMGALFIITGIINVVSLISELFEGGGAKEFGKDVGTTVRSPVDIVKGGIEGIRGEERKEEEEDLVQIEEKLAIREWQEMEELRNNLSTVNNDHDVDVWKRNFERGVFHPARQLARVLRKDWRRMRRKPISDQIEDWDAERASFAQNALGTMQSILEWQITGQAGGTINDFVANAESKIDDLIEINKKIVAISKLMLDELKK